MEKPTPRHQVGPTKKLTANTVAMTPRVTATIMRYSRPVGMRVGLVRFGIQHLSQTRGLNGSAGGSGSN